MALTQLPRKRSHDQENMETTFELCITSVGGGCVALSFVRLYLTVVSGPPQPGTQLAQYAFDLPSANADTSEPTETKQEFIL